MSRGSSVEEYECRCLSRGEAFRVNAPVRETVIAEGRPLCGRSVSPTHLSER